MDTGKLRHTIEGYHKGLMTFVAFSPRGGSLLIAGYPATPRGAEEKLAAEIRLFDPQTWKAKRTVPAKGIRDVTFSPDGKTLAIGGEGEVEDKKMKLILQPLED